MRKGPSRDIREYYICRISFQVGCIQGLQGLCRAWCRKSRIRACWACGCPPSMQTSNLEASDPSVRERALHNLQVASGISVMGFPGEYQPLLSDCRALGKEKEPSAGQKVPPPAAKCRNVYIRSMLKQRRNLSRSVQAERNHQGMS